MALILCACGKKEPPRLPLYERPPEPPAKTERAVGQPETPVEELTPSAPTGLEAFVTEGRVVIFWREPLETRVRGYKIFRSDGSGEFKQIGTSQTPAFVDIGKVTSKRAYKIRAVLPEKESPFSEPVIVNPR